MHSTRLSKFYLQKANLFKTECPRATAQFIGLNAVRNLSLVSFILVFSSSIMDMVTNVKAVKDFNSNYNNSKLTVDCEYLEGSSVPNQLAGAFRVDIANVLIIFQMIVLGLSEVGWPMAVFDYYFPVLGSNFGLGPLGIFQFMISIQILSHYGEHFTLVSASFLFVLGCLNMLLGLIFGESAKAKRSISACALGVPPAPSPVIVCVSPQSEQAPSIRKYSIEM